jgi:small subunit ribosomal protein S9
MVAKKEHIVLTSGRKKTAIARVRIKAGNGGIRINGVPLRNISPASAAAIIGEPLELAKGVLGDGFAANLDIDANMRGGGTMGQAYACRTALGKALLQWSESDDLRKAYVDYDRTLIIDDARRREPKKYLRKGARAKPIKSYR